MATAQEIASKIGVSLPSGWDGYSATQKIDWLNTNKVAPEKLVQAGMSQSDVDWMKGQGYTGAPVTATTTEIDKSQSTLSPNFEAYVNEMLAKGQAAANLPFQAYTGERFAGPSALQESAFRSARSIATPEQFGTASDILEDVASAAKDLGYSPTSFSSDYAPGTFTAEYDAGKFDTGLGALKTVQDYMSPYTTGVTDIASREARRQADIGRQAEQARLAQAGAYGGSRQAIMEAERQRNLQQQTEDITTKGLQSAYDRAVAQRMGEAELGVRAQQAAEQAKQFGTTTSLETQRLGEQARQFKANAAMEAQRLAEQSKQFGAQYGLQALAQRQAAGQALGSLGSAQGSFGLQGLQAQLGAGAMQQQLAQQPLDFGYQQFQESVKYPYQQATYMQSLLGGMPLQATQYQANPGQSGMFAALQGGLAGLGLYDALNPKP